MNKKNQIKTDKVKSAVESVNRAIVDFRIEKLSRLSRKALCGITAGTLGAIVICLMLVFTANSADGGTFTGAKEKKVAEKIPCYTIQVNGQKVISLLDQEQAQTVLDKVAAHYQTEGSELINVSYKEPVELVEDQVQQDKIMSADEALTVILTGTKEPKTYTVKDGDSLWDISKKHGMTVEELIAANPQVNPDHLKLDTTLNLFEVKPYIHVILTEQYSTVENINYDIKYENTNTLYKGENQVKTAGTYGKREIRNEVVKENGVLLSTKEVNTKIISDPKPQIVLKGTKSTSTLVGSGKLMNPMSNMEVSSAYGSRGGGRHTGVDLRNPKGTPIKVADDGVVTYTGYKGSYGKLVVVSHGNGIETWYAHCDTINVKTGAVLKKGNQIATVGITGRATGYHLHFEVRKNGTPQNPMKYL
ncbi:MAG: peptidoglycan DD-metalloendopeptidase family protein [Anaerovoracaceae bacterium]|jgi:murein DD-endopeptidase MepM/ murein hydrolase activator NlpD